METLSVTPAVQMPPINLAELRPITPGMAALRLQHLAQWIDMDLKSLRVIDDPWEKEKHGTLLHKAAQMRALAELFRLAQ